MSRHPGAGQGALPAGGPGIQDLEVAAQWFATLADEHATPQDRLAWQAWLAQAPAHRAAWEHIETVSRRFQPLRGHGTAGGQAAAAAVDAGRADARHRRRLLNGLAGVLGLGVAGWMGWRHTPLPELVAALRSDHATGLGERRALVLADGSQVWLNTRTAVQVRYGPQRRQLVLLAGEVLIDTAVDPAHRPFYVETPAGRLQALGTRFNVHQTDRHVRLDVFAGVVEIRTTGGQVHRVHAREAAQFDADRIFELGPAQGLRQAWSRGRIPADEIRLGDLLQELSRYRHGYMQVVPEVADLRVMGVYPADDVEEALRMLEQTLPIHVRRSLPWWYTIEAR